MDEKTMDEGRARYVRGVASDLWGCQSRDATSVVDSRALDAGVNLLNEYANLLSRTPAQQQTQPGCRCGDPNCDDDHTPPEQMQREDGPAFVVRVPEHFNHAMPWLVCVFNEDNVVTKFGGERGEVIAQRVAAEWNDAYRAWTAAKKENA